MPEERLHAREIGAGVEQIILAREVEAVLGDAASYTGMWNRSRIQPMPEILALPISPGIVLKLAKHHPRGRTMAFWIVNGRLVSVRLSAQA